MSRRYVLVMILGVLLMLFSGCGVAKKAQEAAAEKLVESAVEKATGVKVDTDKQTVTMTGQDGQKVEMTVSEEGKVPADFPLPVLSGFKTEGMVETNADGKKGWAGSFEFKDDLKQTTEAYQKALQGMKLEVSTMGSSDEGVVMFVEGEIKGKHYSGMVTFSKGEGINEVGILFGEGEKK